MIPITFEVGAEHVSHGLGIDLDLSRCSWSFGKVLSHLTKRRCDQFVGQ